MSASIAPEASSSRLSSDFLADCLRKVAERDMNATAALYNATSARLLAICLRITQDRAAAEDVLQEVFIKVWNRAAGYDRSRSEPIVWLATLARNGSIDWYRAHKRHIIVSLPEDDVVKDTAPLIEEELIVREQSERAMLMVEELRDEQRACVRAIYYEGLTYAELAVREGVPVGTVKSRIHRILVSLNRAWIDG